MLKKVAQRFFQHSCFAIRRTPAAPFRILERAMTQTDPSSRFQANGLATLIGSLPVTDHGEALSLIFEHTPAIPLWPQLPSNPKEGMLSQFIEGMPGIIEEADRTCFDSRTETFAEEMLAYFEQYLAVFEDPALLPQSPFTVSRERAEGLFALKEAVAGKIAAGKAVAAVKGQMTGPFTLLTGLHDREGRAAYYDQTIREMVVKGLSLKAAWQVRFLADTEAPVILFIDEPALAGLGSSAFLGVSLEELGQELNEIIGAAQAAGGLVGVHVCANTDWEFLLSTSLDIVSFDAYGFFDKLAACKEALYGFLERGGIIGWGIVPTSERELIERETAESLLARWEAQAAQLTRGPWDYPTLLRQTLITPSCGTGSLSLPDAKKVLALTRDLSGLLRDKYL
jgi:methionine synthase II (cobalamin-independent)